ncbi:MAG: helix-turn-helix transcriptional regulator [Pseudomonadales bacterium]|nr:helix-turn-helix transcriptional regulator [Pseudomonadales bacterium]
MTTPTNVQIIEQGGKPMFAVIPYVDYLAAFGHLISKPKTDDTVPHEVMRYVLREDYSLARAWREYLGLTQDEVATKMGITQSALAQIEMSSKPRKATRQKLAEALGINVEQLI